MSKMSKRSKRTCEKAKRPCCSRGFPSPYCRNVAGQRPREKERQVGLGLVVLPQKMFDFEKVRPAFPGDAQNWPAVHLRGTQRTILRSHESLSQAHS